MLLLDNTQFPASEQSSLDVLLGAEGADRIADILASMGSGIKGSPQLRQAAVNIAAEVKTGMQNLLVELKRADGQGLNQLFKAHKNVEGMCYDTFKVKCRFAEMMVSGAALAPGEAAKNAVAYGKYREWKTQRLPGLFAAVQHFNVPNAPAAQSAGVKIDRAATAVLGTLGKPFTNAPLVGNTLTNKVQQQNLVKSAHQVKESVRNEQLSAAGLRAEYTRLTQLGSSDPAVIKSIILTIANLQLMDLQGRVAFLKEVTDMADRGDWVAGFYCKAIRKRHLLLNSVRDQFRAEAASLEPKLRATGDDAILRKLNDGLQAFNSLMQRLLQDNYQKHKVVAGRSASDE